MVGLTVTLPDGEFPGGGIVKPELVQDAALEVQVRVDEAPFAIVDGLAVKVGAAF